ncbi:HAD-like protein [Tilletiaria anomala UBC 951]|uniref:HAD-like protein n=1 Tax=Tilletiaria anomala (strain ATCC 24038 / CBS 436.72 / UBC 951) TaxID=1037660 RepID=A0A066VUS9_TILAU|nr:HAD-like protein [Tilletiaria anomala UBC 951]KDN45472.1 HAD-like protein [Tilletiaria anomala UBC 951]
MAVPVAAPAEGEQPKKVAQPKDAETFYVDAVLFDMDGTLVDSIAAVEAAWGAVAEELGRDPDEVIAATHGKRAVDNLASLKPWIRSHEMDDAVVAFETTILDYADGRRTPSISSRRNSRSGSRRASSSAGVAGRKLSQGSLSGGVSAFGLSQGLSKLSDINAASKETPAFDDEDEDDAALREDLAEALDEEELAFDGAIRILPGVRQMIDAIPEGMYAVATSSARTYAYGAMQRVGIVPPQVTITAEHPELKRGKPHPDPFLLAAKKLGYDPRRCLVIEDSPSGIRAAVASGGITIAVCTSHTYEKVCSLGAHHVVFSLDQVTVTHDEQLGCLKVVVQHPPHAIDAMNAGEVCQGLLPEEVDAAIAKFKELDIAKKKRNKNKKEQDATTAAAAKAAAVGAELATPAAA